MGEAGDELKKTAMHFHLLIQKGIDSLLVHVSHPWIVSPQLGKIKAILWRKRPRFKAMELRDARNFHTIQLVYLSHGWIMVDRTWANGRPTLPLQCWQRRWR